MSAFNGSVAGLTSSSGEKWIEVTKDDQAAYIPLYCFQGNMAAALKRLAKRGIMAIGSDQVSSLQLKVQNISDFPRVQIVESVGWNGPHFALESGQLFSPTQGSVPVGFEPSQSVNTAKGKLSNWKKSVAMPLQGHSVAMFALTLPFLPPLLRFSHISESYGFELVGPKGIGKSTLVQLTASVAGSIGFGSSRRYWLKFDEALGDLQGTCRRFSDQLILADDASPLSFDGTKGAKSRSYADIMSAINGGATSGGDQNNGRHIWLTTSNTPIAQLASVDDATINKTNDVLLTIPLGDRDYGAFQCIPEGYKNLTAFAEQLTSLSEQNHGLAMQRFLARLVVEATKRPKRLSRRMKASVELFRKRAGINLFDGAAVRRADRFGLVFAAGQLAKKFGCLPGWTGLGPAVLEIYELHARALRTPPGFDQIIAAFENEAVLLATGTADRTKPIAKSELRAASAFIKEAEGRRELWIRKETFRQRVPSWKNAKSTGLAKSAGWQSEQGHDTVKRCIISNKAERVYCFSLNVG
jgi:hypothetical protein